MKEILTFMALSLCLWSCQPSTSSTEVAMRKVVPPPPPPPNINELPDAINKTEEAGFYSGFALVRAFDERQKNAPVKRCGYKFNSFFYDEEKLAATQSANVLLFHYSCFNNPMYFEKGKLTNKWVDDEWEETVFFQLPSHDKFRYVDKELLRVKLCATTSASAVLKSGSGRYFIQKGFLEGKRINDSVYNVRIEARYRAVMSDTSYWVPVWVDTNFKRRCGFSKPWEYQCPLFKKVEE